LPYTCRTGRARRQFQGLYRRLIATEVLQPQPQQAARATDSELVRWRWGCRGIRF
jgi:hypothetical protein